MQGFTSFLALLTSLFGMATSQIPIPKRPLGFVYKDGSPIAPIHLEAFVDLTCPDCKQAWPTVEKVADIYGPNKLQVTVQLFPLPYHTNAFLAAQSVYAVDGFNSSLVTRWMDFLFEHQSQLYNFQTMDKNRFEVINIVSGLGNKIGVPPSVMESGLTNPHYDENTRISRKYGCSRTVSGTPFFFINGIFVSEASSSWSLKDWENLIDPLLQK